MRAFIELSHAGPTGNLVLEKDGQLLATSDKRVNVSISGWAAHCYGSRHDLSLAWLLWIENGHLYLKPPKMEEFCLSNSGIKISYKIRFSAVNVHYHMNSHSVSARFHFPLYRFFAADSLCLNDLSNSIGLMVKIGDSDFCEKLITNLSYINEEHIFEKYRNRIK